MSISCSFCIHVNPEGSKFCNECGSPLRLKPCADCDAVNDHDAIQCHQCGASLDGGSERAHELAESVRTRESESGTYEAADSASEPAFFDQYLTALRRDMAAKAAEDQVSEERSELAAPIDGFAHAASAAATADAQSTAQPPLGISAAARSATAEQPPAPPDMRSRVQARPMSVQPSPEPRQPAALGGAQPQPPRRSVLSPVLYIVGAGLLLVGILGYGRYLRDPLPQIQQWFANLRSHVAGSPQSITASRSITELRTTPDTIGAPATQVERVAAPAASPTPAIGDSTSALMPPETPATAAPARASPTPSDPPAPSQSPATTAESAYPAESSQPLATSAPSQANASKSVRQAADTPRQVSRNETTRTKQRRPSGVAAIAPSAPAAPAPAEPTDTGTTTASPLAPICTKGIAALGLCDPNSSGAN